MKWSSEWKIEDYNKLYLFYQLISQMEKNKKLFTFYQPVGGHMFLFAFLWVV